MCASALREADAALLVLLCEALVSHPDQALTIFSPTVPLSQTKHLTFCTSWNLLRVLLIHASPVAVEIANIANIAQSITDSFDADLDVSETDLVSDVEDLCTWLTDKFQVQWEDNTEELIERANDLTADLAVKAQELGFEKLPELTDSANILFAFAKAKTLQLSAYFADVSGIPAYFDSIRSFGPLQAWYQGVIAPYEYYYMNYAQPNDICSPESEYLALTSYEDTFEFLISPLDTSDSALKSKISPEPYFAHVILPNIVYNNSNMMPISAWMYSKHSACDTHSEFLLWDEILKTVIGFKSYNGSTFNKTEYEPLVRHYLNACLYFGFVKEHGIKSVEKVRIQDQICATLTHLVSMTGTGPVDFSLYKIGDTDSTKFDSLKQFATSNLSPGFQILSASLESALACILSAFSTCSTLNTSCDISIQKYFWLKSEDPSSKAFLKEAMLFLSRIDYTNRSQMSQSLSTFHRAFLSDKGKTTMQAMDIFVFERLVQVEDFDEAKEYLESLPDERRIPHENAFQLLSRKFWELFGNASNLDDRIGKLKLASQCLNMMNTISRHDNFTKSERATVTKITHLMKAIHSLKNFKLVIVRNQPVTPKQILEQLSQTDNIEKFPPFALISLVLEQNPKSYLAYEKLYKIVNDLGIFLEIDLGTISFPRVQSACVESALIDGNFDFAYNHSKTLLSHYISSGKSEQLNEIWLMFYQVGKYIMPEWFNDYDSKVQERKLEVLLRQKELLSLALKHTKPAEFTVDNSRLLVGQLRHLNQEIQRWYEEAELHGGDDMRKAMKPTHEQIQDNITGLIGEASQTRQQASEKLSKLFVSGLGWAIGARR